MRLIISIVGGLIGGAVGAAVWAAIAYYSNYEIGIIAWLIGVVVGAGMAAVAGDDRDLMHGVIASVIALGSIAMAKYAVVHILISGVTNNLAGSISIDDQSAKMHMAEDLITEYETKGRALKWPEGKDLESAEAPEDYPKDLWADTEKRWNAMKPEAQAMYKKQLEDYRKSQLAGLNSSMEKSILLKSFSLFDLLWAFLAVGSAFKIASGSSSESE